MHKPSKTFFHDQHGFTLIEAMVVVVITAILFGLTLTPVTQLKNLETGTNFLRELESTHQIALQKARNAEQLKRILTNTPNNAAAANWEGTLIDRCFGGRGTGCNAFARANFLLPDDNTNYRAVGASKYTVVTRTLLTVTCDSTKCTQAILDVFTEPGPAPAGTVNVHQDKKYQQRVIFPASVLSSRQEIDFSACAGKIITGVDYATLTARCIPPTGQDTCEGIAPNAGPMLIFGQPANISNCQVPANTSCPNGMTAVGMMDGQPQCVSAITCSDPFSITCSPPVCTPNWMPSPATICAGDIFVQTDLNNCPPGPATRNDVGTNILACAPSCSFAGTVKWPNSTTGPCGNTSVNIKNNPPSADVVPNATIGFTGSMTVSCIDNSPLALPDAYDFIAAPNTCQPITCAGLSGEVQWSSVGIRSAVAGPGLDPVGPWPCKGNLALTQASVLGAGILASTQADSTARADAVHTPDANASSGNIRLTCNDPGPATNGARVGQTVVSSFSCVTPPPPVACGFGPVGSWEDLGDGPAADYNQSSYTCTTISGTSLSGTCKEPAATGTGDGCLGLNSCLSDAVSGSGITIKNEASKLSKINLACSGGPPPVVDPPTSTSCGPGGVLTSKSIRAGSCADATHDTNHLPLPAGVSTDVTTADSTANNFDCPVLLKPGEWCYQGISEPDLCGPGVGRIGDISYCVPSPPSVSCNEAYSETCSVGGGCDVAAWNNYQDWAINQFKALGYPDPTTTFNTEFTAMADFYNTVVAAGKNFSFKSYSQNFTFGPYNLKFDSRWEGLEMPLPGKFQLTNEGTLSGTHPVTGADICAPCTISSWTPVTAAGDICTGKSIEQISNCGTKQTISGTKVADWRLLPGNTPMDPATWIEADHFTTESVTFSDINSCDSPSTITKTGTKPPMATCSPIGSLYLWNGVNWDDYGMDASSWPVSLSGYNMSTPPSAIAADVYLGNGITQEKSPPALRCTGAPLPTGLCHFYGNGTFPSRELNLGDQIKAPTGALGPASQNGEWSCDAEPGYDCRMINEVSNCYWDFTAIAMFPQAGYGIRNSPPGTGILHASCGDSGGDGYLICQSAPPALPPPSLCWSRNPAWDASFVSPGICSLSGSCATAGASVTTKCLDTSGNMTSTQVACYATTMNECTYAVSDECNVPFPSKVQCEDVFGSCVLSGGNWKKDCGGKTVATQIENWATSSENGGKCYTQKVGTQCKMFINHEGPCSDDPSLVITYDEATGLTTSEKIGNENCSNMIMAPWETFRINIYTDGTCDTSP